MSDLRIEVWTQSVGDWGGLPCKWDLDTAPEWVREEFAKGGEFGTHDPAEVFRKLAGDSFWRVRMAVAKNPECPVEVLEALSRDGAAVVRFSVARNENTPLEVLERLSRDHDARVLQCVAENVRTPVGVLERLSKRSGERGMLVRAAVARHAKTSLEVLDELGRDKALAVRRAVVQGGNAGRLTLTRMAKAEKDASLLVELASHEDMWVRQEAARNVRTPLEALRELSRDEVRGIRKVVAQNPECPVDVLDRLGRDKTWEVRMRVAEHPRASAEALEWLAREDMCVHSLRGVARNENTPGEALAHLVGRWNCGHEIRAEIAANPNTPADALAWLCTDSAMDVRAAAYRNKRTPVDMLLQRVQEGDLLGALSLSGHEMVRIAVASHPDTLPNILSVLARDESESVRLAVLGHSKTPEFGVETVMSREPSSAATREAFSRLAASHPNCPLDLLEKLSWHHSNEVRLQVVVNPETPPELLKVMEGREEDWEVRKALAANPASPPEVLKASTRATWYEVRRAAAYNCKSPPEVLAELAGDRDWQVREAVALNPNTPPAVLVCLGTDEDAQVRNAVHHHSAVSAEAIVQAADPHALGLLAHSLNEEVRAAVVRDPRTPLEVLEVLWKDTAPKVFKTFEENAVAALRKLGHSDRPENRKRVAKTLMKIVRDGESRAARHDARQALASMAMHETVPELLVDMVETLPECCGGVLGRVAQNENTPKDTLKELASHSSVMTRNGVTMAKHAPADVLRRLSRDNEWVIRAGVARHPFCPGDVLERLSEDVNLDVRLAVVRNEEAPVDLLRRLFREGWKGVTEAERTEKQAWEGILLYLVANPSCPPDVLAEMAGMQDKFRIAAAKHPRTSDETLAKLARDADDWVRAAVARNEGVPAELLAQLSQDSAVVRDAVMGNPSIEGGLLGEMASKEKDLSLLWKLAEHSAAEIRRVVAANPSATADLLTTLARDESGHVRVEVARNPNTPVDTLRVLATSQGREGVTLTYGGCTTADMEADFLYAVAGNPSCPPELLAELAEVGDRNQRNVSWKVAENPSTPAAVLDKLGRSEDWTVRKAVARNPEASTFVLMLLAADPNLEVRGAIANNKGAPAGALEMLVADESSGVRYLLASNPATPVSVLRDLATDHDSSVRLHVGWNPSTPEEVLREWAQGDEQLYRKAVAANRNAPVDLLKMLSRDETEQVRISALGSLQELLKDVEGPQTRSQILYALTERAQVEKHPEVLRILSHCDHVDVVTGVAENPNTTPATLHRLASHPSASVRGAVAKNKSCPAVLLKKLAKDATDSVRCRVAADPSLPVETLKVLAWDGYGHVRCMAASNPSLPEEVLRKLATPEGKKGADWSGVFDEEELLCTWVARNPKCPADLLEELSHRTSVGMLLEAVAQHPSTPLEVLKRLAQDRRRSIRRMVLGNPSTTLKMLEEAAKYDESDCLRALAQERIGESLPSYVSPELSADFLGLPDSKWEGTGITFLRAGDAPSSNGGSIIITAGGNWSSNPCGEVLLPVESAEPEPVVIEELPEEEPTVRSVVGAAILASILKRCHPAAPLALESGREMAVAEVVQKALEK